MTDSIKRMLADRAALKAAARPTEYRIEQGFERGVYRRTKHDDLVDEVFQMIDRAAPFMDDGCGPREWPPSVKLKIVYCILVTSDRAKPRRALQWVLRMLDRARELWVNGLHPNPWSEAPEPRR